MICGDPVSCNATVWNRSQLRERRPGLAQAVTAALICWSFSNSRFRYRLVDHAVPAIWRNLAAARLSADCPSAKEPTTRVRRPISRRMRSSRCWCGYAANAPPRRRSRPASPPSPLAQSCSRGETQAVQLLDHWDSLVTGRPDVLAGTDRLEHRRDLAHLGRRHLAEDVGSDPPAHQLNSRIFNMRVQR